MNRINKVVEYVYTNNLKKEKGITLVALVITMVLHYYYCIKYSNFNGFLESNV